MIFLYFYDTFEDTKKVINGQTYSKNHELIAVKDTSMTLHSQCLKEGDEVKLFITYGYGDEEQKREVTGLHLTDEQDLISLFESFRDKTEFRNTMKDSKDDVTYNNSSFEQTKRLLNGKEYPDNLVLFGINELGCIIYSGLKKGAKRLFAEYIDNGIRKDADVTGIKVNDEKGLIKTIEDLITYDKECKPSNKNPEKLNSFSKSNRQSDSYFTEPRLSIADLAFLTHSTLEEADSLYRTLEKRKSKTKYSKDDVAVRITRSFKDTPLKDLKPSINKYQDDIRNSGKLLAIAELKDVRILLTISDKGFKVVDGTTDSKIKDSDGINALTKKSDMIDYLKNIVIIELSERIS